MSACMFAIFTKALIFGDGRKEGKINSLGVVSGRIIE